MSMLILLSHIISFLISLLLLFFLSLFFFFFHSNVIFSSNLLSICYLSFLHLLSLTSSLSFHFISFLLFDCLLFLSYPLLIPLIFCISNFIYYVLLTANSFLPLTHLTSLPPSLLTFFLFLNLFYFFLYYS